MGNHRIQKYSTKLAGGVLQKLTNEGIIRMSIKTGVSFPFELLFSMFFIFSLQNFVSRDADISFATFREGKFHCE